MTDKEKIDEINKMIEQRIKRLDLAIKSSSEIMREFFQERKAELMCVKYEIKQITERTENDNV